MAAFWATIFFSQNKKTVKDYLLKGFLSSLSFSRLFLYLKCSSSLSSLKSGFATPFRHALRTIVSEYKTSTFPVIPANATPKPSSLRSALALSTRDPKITPSLPYLEFETKKAPLEKTGRL